MPIVPICVVFCVLTAQMLASCQDIFVPSDVHDNVLDPVRAVQESDTITFAEAVSQRDLRQFVAHLPSRSEPTRVAEVEVELKVLQVLKGEPTPQEIRFRYSDARGYVQIGPPQGPSGGLGSKGIFFLKKTPNGLYRSIVDVYRPDIPTPWLYESVERPTCTTPSECVAKLLLTYHQFDNLQSFTSHLLENVAISEQLIGFLDTFELLSFLVIHSHPEIVAREGCIQLSRWYALEIPPVCSTMVDNELWQYTLANAEKQRKALKNGGIGWIRHQIKSKDDNQVKRYLKLLMNSADGETRTLAVGLLKSVDHR